MCFGDLKLSIQASDFHYCTPRRDCGWYSEVEVGFPNFNFSDEFIFTYAEDVGTPQEAFDIEFVGDRYEVDLFLEKLLK